MGIYSIVFAWVKPETKFWGGIVFLLIAALGYLAVKATRGYAIGYTKYKISGGVMATLVFVQGFGSLMLALMLPTIILMRSTSLENYTNKTNYG
jgi:hypothetical protein